MAFSKKMQEVFKVLMEDIKKLGGSFDFFKEAKALEKYLKDAGLSIKAPQFIAEIFEELEYPRSGWKPDREEITRFFKALPDRIKKEKVSDDILVKYVPKEDWGSFKKEYANARLRVISEVSKKRSPVVLITKWKDKNQGCACATITVYLGDVRDRLGITTSELKSYTYKYVYSAVDENIGGDVVLAELERKKTPLSFRLLDYPNASCLEDAKYEFLVKAKPGMPLSTTVAKTMVITALKNVGLV